TSNIMSLGGIAIAIGVIVDASIVLVENAYRNVAHAQEEKSELTREDYVKISIMSAKQVGPAIFFSVAIMVVSFLPVFLLEGQEGKLFHPLAYTKTFVLTGSAIIAITLVPVLMTMLTRGKFRTEKNNPVTRWLIRIYMPVVRWVLQWRKTTIALNILALLVTIPVMMRIGSEFMPPLDEGSLLYMPVLLPNVSITEAKRVLQEQDAIIKSVPEVDRVIGKAGRAETPVDPAPVSMVETIITLKPKEEWRPGITKDSIIAELDAKLRIPGVRNGWTQPIINRINMLSTGVRTDLGIKIFGNDLDTLEKLGIEAEEIVKNVHGAADVYAERQEQGSFIDIKIDRNAVARYGINVGDVQDIIETAIGGENIGTVIQGRERFPIRVRDERDWRNNINALNDLLVPVRFSEQAPSAGMTGASMGAGPTQNDQSQATYVPLSQLATISLTTGPPMISSENSRLRSIVYLNVRGRDMGGFVSDAKQALEKKLTLPPGYSVQWSGQWENEVRAQNRLLLVMPVVFFIIFIMLYFTTKSTVEAGVVMLSVPFALIGGVYLIAILGYNFSVAVWVGFISLYGLAVETGVVMVVYLHEALDRRLRDVQRGKRGPLTRQDVVDATIEGAVMRVRPKVMTVATAAIGLLPIMWSTGTGSDVMKPIAAPMLGGLITSAIHVLVVTPILFSWMKERALKKGTLEISKMAGWMKE
ncbi:MAG TPA: efflux RND transporter permease subunit, partial [Candidatus Kapabacteria bacterium]|nr:efflux RND transporter permease subunit [Candidatus Kapabacteria bacterium]